jgi:5'(3')-deoxyribonucleotidase
MIEVNWSAVIGAGGTACSALSFVPQVLKVRREGGRDLSTGTIALLLAGASLWFAYGVLNDVTSVVVANVAVFGLVSTVAVIQASRGDQGARRSRRPRIAIDMDEVMADSLAEYLRRYNAAYGTNLTAADIHGFHLEDYVPSEHRAATEAMLDASFFEDLDVLPDCQSVILELTERYEVFIASAAMDVPYSFDAKYRWLRRHFPFIPPTHIVFCGDKTIVDADYLIDDRARHFERFRGTPLLFSAPHNAAETRYTRVASWKDVREQFALTNRETGAMRSFVADVA